jgi:SRSO17 transposase
MPANTDFETMLGSAKLRWRIERDYQDLKQELGLGHYEGRGWRGLHRHVTLCIAAYEFLIAERAALPPSATGNQRRPGTVVVSTRHRSRGPAIAHRATRSELHNDDPTATYRRTGRPPGAVPLSRLRADDEA